MIRIGGGDLKTLPTYGKELVLWLHTANPFVVDTDPLTAKLLAQAPITVARKLSLYPFDVMLSVTAGLSFNVALGLVVITARCQVHDFDPLGNRAKLSAVITEGVPFLCRRSQSPSFFR